jgi:hypothetical protein
MAKRVTKNQVNFNTLKTGCSPCFNEAQKIERKIRNRKVSEIKIEEIKKIVSSIFEKKNK